MKRILFGLLLLAGIAQAQTTTNLHLNTPAKGASNWDSSLNANFTTLDSKLGALAGSNTLQNLLDLKSPLASPSFSGTVTFPITGSTQCLHVNSAGVLSGSGGDCSSGGLGDPGSNGLIKRTSLNTTGSAAGSDVIALWTGTCSSTTYLRGDGSCQNPPGGGNVSNSGTPATGQIPVWQSSTTQSGVTNVSFPGDAYFKGRPWVDVRNYGAVGNGSTDDLAAFNSAVAAAANLGTISGNPFGAIVYVPSGSYAFSDRIVLPKGVSNTFGHGTVSIIGGGKTNTAFLALSSFPSGHCLIEWTTATTGRVLSQTIQGVTFKDTTVDKQCDIGYAYSATNSPATTSNATNERMERLTIQDVEFQGSNQYQDKHLKLVGDCYDCRIDVETNDSRGSVHNYDTIAVFIDDCYTSTAPNNETCGFTYGEVKVNTVGNRGGYMAAFNGRMNQGSVGGFSNGVYNTNAWRISNSFFPELSLITEGLGGQPEVSVINTMGATFKRLDIGAPSNEGGGSGDGADFVNSSNNTILHASAANGASSAWSQQTTMTTYSGLTAGTGYTSGATWTGSGGACLTQPSGTTTLSGGGVATLVVVNAGLCQTGHAPTIGFTGGGGSGAAATPTMTAAGLFHLKFDSNSVNNTGWDIHTNGGTGEISLSNTTKNLLQTCDQSSSLCNAYTAMGSLSGIAIDAGALTSGATAVARGGTGTGSTLTGLMRGNASAMTAAELSGAVATSGSNAVTVPFSSVIGLKADSSSGVQFVAPTCNGNVACSDSNDGLFLGTAKLTLAAACEALPGGASSPATCGHGTITVAQSAWPWADHTCGMWFMGPSDPNYSSPPNCWIKLNTALTINCISGSTSWAAASHVPQCFVHGPTPGRVTDVNHPVLSFSSINVPVSVNGLYLESDWREMNLGVCSDGTNVCNSSSISFSGFGTASAAGSASGGPGVLIAGNTFEIYFNDFVLAGNADAVSTTDNNAAVLIQDLSGLIHFNRGVFQNGGVVVKYGTTYANDVYSENAVNAIFAAPATANLQTAFYLNNVSVSDCASAACLAVQNLALPASQVQLIGSVQSGLSPVGGRYTHISGPYDFVNANPLSSNISVGLFNERMIAQQDSSRRQFGPVAVANLNLAALPSSGTGVTTGVDDPAGGHGAITFAPASGASVNFYLNASITPVVGDWWVGAVQVRARTSAGFVAIGPGQPAGIFMPGSGSFVKGRGSDGGTFSPAVYCSPQWRGKEMEWMWVWCAAKVATSTGTTAISFAGQSDATHPADFYGPVFFKIGTGTMSDAEVLERASNLQSYGSCAQGIVCGLPGQTLQYDTMSSKNHLFNGSSGGTTTVVPAASASGTLTLPAATDTLVARATTDTLTNKTLTSPVLGGTPDASGATHFKLPVAAGYAAIANGNFGYDTTNKNWHAWGNAVDNLVAVLPVSVTPANNDCPKWVLSSGVYTLGTTGAACGAGGSVAWSGITDAAGALTLANAGNATTFTQTSAVTWTWSDITAATSGSVGNAPVIRQQGTYWTGSVSANETLDSALTVATGTNGAITQTWTLTGDPNNGTSATTFRWTDASTTGASPSDFVFRRASTDGLRIRLTGTPNTTLDGVNGALIVQRNLGGFGITTASFVGLTLGGGQSSDTFTGTTGTQTGVLITSGGGDAATSGNRKFISTNITGTINQTGSASGDFTLIQGNLTQTAALGTNILLEDLQVGGTTKWKVDNSGNARATNSVGVNGLFGAAQSSTYAVCETAGAATTLATGAATTDTGLNCLPATAIIDAVVYRITTSITTSASFTIGDATTAARFCGTQSTLTSGTTGTCFVQADQTGAPGPRQSSAAAVRVTLNANPGAGAIRLQVFYHTWTAPTS